MKFAELEATAFSGGVLNLHATLFETVAETIERDLQHDSRPCLVILNDAEARPEDGVRQELAAVRHLYPNARILVTARSVPPSSGAVLQLNLSALSRSEFDSLLRQRLGQYSSFGSLNKLYDAFQGHPLAAKLAADLLRAGDLSPQELLDRLRAFTSSGIVGPHGETILEQSEEHRHLVSDVVAVSDEFLRRLHGQPGLLHQLTPRGFEELVAELLGRLKYEVTLTPASKDGGKDIYAAKKDHLGTFLYVVECKKYAPDHPVGVGVVRQLNGVVQAERATAGILATTSFFTKGAKEFQQKISFQLSLKDYLGIRDWIESALANGERQARELRIAERQRSEDVREMKQEGESDAPLQATQGIEE